MIKKNTENAKPEASKKITVLIIDDDEGLRDVIQKRLYRHKFDVEVATNGKHAISEDML